MGSASSARSRAAASGSPRPRRRSAADPPPQQLRGATTPLDEVQGMGISTTETYGAGEVGTRHHDEQAKVAGDQDHGGRSTPALLTPEQRSSLIARLDAFNDQLAEASMQLDYGSLDRAADLAAL